MDFETIILVGLIFILLIIFVYGFGFLVKDADNLEPVEIPEQPHLYWKTIEAEVVSVNKKHWYASTHHYELAVTVYSAEYNITTTLTENSMGAVTPNHWNVTEDDKINVTLYSWVMDSTGEVIRREIHAFA